MLLLWTIWATFHNTNVEGRVFFQFFPQGYHFGIFLRFLISFPFYWDKGMNDRRTIQRIETDHLRAKTLDGVLAGNLLWRKREVPRACPFNSIFIWFTNSVSRSFSNSFIFISLSVTSWYTFFLDSVSFNLSSVCFKRIRRSTTLLVSCLSCTDSVLLFKYILQFATTVKMENIPMIRKNEVLLSILHNRSIFFPQVILSLMSTNDFGPEQLSTIIGNLLVDEVSLTSKYNPTRAKEERGTRKELVFERVLFAWELNNGTPSG